MALQGMFDYPHNKVNNQLLENIDIKKADQKYHDKFKSFNTQNAYKDLSKSQEGKSPILPTYRLGAGHKHHQSLSAIDERREDQRETEDFGNHIQSKANNYSRNNYQNINSSSDKNFESLPRLNSVNDRSQGDLQSRNYHTNNIKVRLSHKNLQNQLNPQNIKKYFE
mmetsp:Transcript_12217/g.10832  ORF Transcript_12217/g.10832 Transcript_12217/m.10832 type:complete len:167 (+) Transcript_12217:135-635(+)